MIRTTWPIGSPGVIGGATWPVSPSSPWQATQACANSACPFSMFGVPTIEVDGRTFWGLDALEMLADCLRGGAWFQGPGWLRAGESVPGVQR